MHFEGIDRATSGDRCVLELLRQHPRVRSVAESPLEHGVTFDRGGKARQVLVGGTTEPLRGLAELMDNNPLVCADRVSVPDPASTLAVIALGPLADAGLILEAPVFITNQDVDEGVLDGFLGLCGWRGGVTVCKEPTNTPGLAMGTCIVAIKSPENIDEIDTLFDDRYGRTFFIRLAGEGGVLWEPSSFLGQPYAGYQLRISSDGETSLLTVQVMADENGKCGAAQVIHAMNVMAGFEETLGLEASLPVCG